MRSRQLFRTFSVISSVDILELEEGNVSHLKQKKKENKNEERISL